VLLGRVKAAKYVLQEKRGRKEPLTHTLRRMQIWLLPNTVRIQTMLKKLKERSHKWAASLKNGVIKIGSGLIQAATSLVSAVLPKTSKTQTAVSPQPKPDPSPSPKESPPPQRKSAKAKKAKPSSKTQKPRKSNSHGTGAKSPTKKPRGRPPKRTPKA